jgi:N6-adenosine-specific RNA methylase IME4
MGDYLTILADPPWRQCFAGKYRSPKNKRREKLAYPTMSLAEIKSLPVAGLAAEECHLWLWTTNQHLEAGFEVLRAWGFTYLAPVHWIKKSGCGNYFIHRTQTVLFGYRQKCRFPQARYVANIIEANPIRYRHSAKPEPTYDLIERVSPGPRLELFARRKRKGWDVWGNEVESDISLSVF